MTENILYKKKLYINDNISIHIPTVGEVIDNEDEYYSLVTAITSTPYDMMVQLDDIGVDFETIDDYTLFIYMFTSIQQQKFELIFEDLDLTKFKLAENIKNKTIFFYDEENDISIDKGIYYEICKHIRKINFLKRNNKRPGNTNAKEYILKRARIKQERARKRKRESELESLIVSMVNDKNFKYDFNETRELTIYQLNYSVQQIIHKVNYENLMHGAYSGTVNLSEVDQSRLNWLKFKF